MRKSHLIITILLLILGAICYIFFEAVPTKILEDPLGNKLLCGFISRIGLSLLFGWLLYIYGGRKYMVFSKTFFALVAWSLPCFMVAFVNFPYSAIITGTASIIRGDLMVFYTLYILGVAILEELIFRGVLLIIISDIFKRNRHCPLLTTVVCSAIFSIFHLTNLFSGASIGSVLLQCVYTFLIGAMLTVTMLKLKNIWLCMLIHAIFDFGGLLIINVGSGNPWDVMFWILTITSGVLAAGHIIYSLLKLDYNYVSE